MYSERLSNFYVLVSDVPFTSTDLNTTLNQAGVSSYYTAGQGGTPTAQTVNRSGRYVRVQLAAPGVLSLAEVEVLGTTLSPAVNLALNKATVQSSEAYGGVSSRAVDGNTSGNWADATVTHTNAEAGAWWQVDLGSQQSIQSIEVWNRTDCCSERLTNFNVLVLDQNQNPVASFNTSGQAGRPTSISVNQVGRYVKVQLVGFNALSLAEVQVWGQGGGAGAGVADVEWLVNDQLGTPRMVVDQTGTLAGVKRHDYLPFGEELFAGSGGRTVQQGYSVSDGVRQKFTKYERDNETGLDYAKARYYSAMMGRYTSVDPIVVTPERFFDPQQFNLYAYTRNNPLRFIDPTGETLTISGDIEEIKKQLADMLGIDDAAKHISFDEKTGTITVDLTGIDLSKNEGAALLNDTISSKNVYDIYVGSSVETLGGQLSLIPTKDNAYKTMTNLDNNPDDRLSKEKTDKEKPKKGVNDQIGINYDYRDKHGESNTKLKLAPNWTTTFHELAEAYAKVEHNKQYEQAHQEAIDRETKLRDQRPYLKDYNPGSGPGTTIIIKNK